MQNTSSILIDQLALVNNRWITSFNPLCPCGHIRPCVQWYPVRKKMKKITIFGGFRLSMIVPRIHFSTATLQKGKIGIKCWKHILGGKFISCSLLWTTYYNINNFSTFFIFDLVIKSLKDLQDSKSLQALTKSQCKSKNWCIYSWAVWYTSRTYDRK